jgi:hypothetical protein
LMLKVQIHLGLMLAWNFSNMQSIAVLERLIGHASFIQSSA